MHAAQTWVWFNSCIPPSIAHNNQDEGGVMCTKFGTVINHVTLNKGPIYLTPPNKTSDIFI